MSKDTMRTILFVAFLTVLGVSVVLTIWGTVAFFQNPSSEFLWAFVKLAWGIVFVEIIGFLVALAKNLFGQRAYELAREIARKWAQDIVTSSDGDRDALNTAYWDTRADLGVYFRSQGAGWLKALADNLRSETMVESRRFPGLRDWEPPTEVPNLDPVPMDESVPDAAQ